MYGISKASRILGLASLEKSCIFIGESGEKESHL